MQTEQERKRQVDERKGSDRQWYSSTQWRALRLMMLRRQPLCPCGAAASEVHHIVDRKERPDLAFNMDNLQALCKPCHSRETMDRMRSVGGRAAPREQPTTSP